MGNGFGNEKMLITSFFFFRMKLRLKFSQQMTCSDHKVAVMMKQKRSFLKENVVGGGIIRMLMTH